MSTSTQTALALNYHTLRLKNAQAPPSEASAAWHRCLHPYIGIAYFNYRYRGHLIKLKSGSTTAFITLAIDYFPLTMT
jgi:hypothetical protein